MSVNDYTNPGVSIEDEGQELRILRVDEEKEWARLDFFRTDGDGVQVHCVRGAGVEVFRFPASCLRAWLGVEEAVQGRMAL